MKKSLMMIKKVIYKINFLNQTETLLVKVVNNSRFFLVTYVQNSRFSNFILSKILKL